MRKVVEQGGGNFVPAHKYYFNARLMLKIEIDFYFIITHTKTFGDLSHIFSIYNSVLIVMDIML